MLLLFVSLSIPILVFILVFNYNRTSRAIIATLHEQVGKTRLATIDSAQNLIQRVAASARSPTARFIPDLLSPAPSKNSPWQLWRRRLTPTGFGAYGLLPRSRMKLIM
jgi:hypothetical protein